MSLTQGSRLSAPLRGSLAGLELSIVPPRTPECRLLQGEMQQELRPISLPEHCDRLLGNCRHPAKARETQGAEPKSRVEALSPDGWAAFEQRPWGVSEGKGPGRRTHGLCRDSQATDHRDLGVHTAPSPSRQAQTSLSAAASRNTKGPRMCICMKPWVPVHREEMKALE